MKKGKESFVALVLLSAFLFGGTAKAGESKVYNWSDHAGVANCEKVLISEDILMNGEYILLPGNTITRMYGWGPTTGNPTDHKLSDLAIEVDKAYFNRLFLTADVLVPNGADNYLLIKKPTTPPDFEKRNFVMKQNSDSPSSHTDPNIYDLLDLTNNFTQDGHIILPNITALTPRGTDNPYDLWDHVISNYADIQPSVVGNSNNKWCEYVDLDRDGNVDYNDLDKFSEQWLVGTNSIR
ncbi:MAG: hypothetical protein ACYSSL_07545 [Planctomycetota bacterium]|jgi:hypothetical protein